jgi:hypothetical protein
MTSFTLEETGRIEALRAAGDLLKDLGLLHEESGTVDLINLAFFIHTGLDPHDSRLGRQPTFPDAAEWDAQTAAD